MYNMDAIGQMDKSFSWDPDKNAWLKDTRGFGFEVIVEAIENGRLLDDLEHMSGRYARQRVFVVNLDGYAIAVPYVEDETQIILKTAFPDRKLNKMYIGDHSHE